MIVVSIQVKDSFFCIYTGTAGIFPLELLTHFQDINPFFLTYAVGVLREVVAGSSFWYSTKILTMCNLCFNLLKEKMDMHAQWMEKIG